MSESNDAKLSVLLAATPDASRAEVEKRYKENGYVDAVSYLWDEKLDFNAKYEAEHAVNAHVEDSKYYKLFVQDFNVKEHFSQVCSHRKFIKKAYQRFQNYLTKMRPDDAEKHDLSKFMMAQAVGYTARWVHNTDNKCWKEALDHHYCNEPHHPQYYKGKRMEMRYLEESLIDMAASRWERQLQGNDDATDYDIVDFNPVYLSRYDPDDRKIVEALIKDIQDGKQKGNSAV